MSDAAVSRSGVELSLSISTFSSSTSANSDIVLQLYLADICERRRWFQVYSQPITIINLKNGKWAAHSHSSAGSLHATSVYFASS